LRKKQDRSRPQECQSIKTAKTIGVQISESFLLRVDEVIE